MLLRKYAIKACFIFPVYLTSASALPGKARKTQKSHLFNQLHAMPDFIQWLLDFFNLGDLQFIFTLL